jgi:ADP-ribosylglycohydrolase
MYKKIYSSMMGTALGDSIGLPFEGLSRAKIAKKSPSFKAQSLFFGIFDDCFSGECDTAVLTKKE